MDIIIRRGFLSEPQLHTQIDSIRIQCEDSEYMVFYDKDTDGISIRNVISPIEVLPQNISSVIIKRKNA